MSFSNGVSMSITAVDTSASCIGPTVGIGSDIGEHARSIHRWVLFATVLGSVIEWYDFFIYATAAALVFGKLFFPNFDPAAGTLASFGTFAVGMFARPIGAIVFGHFGDRIGRKSMLMFTMLMMGLPTIAIGLIPTYQTIGVWAAIGLVVFRLVQGIALGGEWGGGVLMAVEHAPNTKKALFGSMPQIGSPAGLLLATVVFAMVSQLPEDSFLSWGWRLPFLVSVLLIVLSIVVRMRLPESPEFLRVEAARKKVAVPLGMILSRHLRSFLLTVGVKLGEVTLFYMVTVFVLSYVTSKLNMPKQTALNCLMIGAGLACVTMPIFGTFADRLGRRTIVAVGGLYIALFAFPMFWMVDTREPLLLLVAVTGALAIGHPFIFGPQPGLIATQFPAEVRYSGISLGVQVAGAIGGGLAPIVATTVLESTGGTSMIALYLATMGVVSAVSAMLMRPALETTL
jgi:MFS transporter, MHS family, shikimate and dehydroshikimate transport protein